MNTTMPRRVVVTGMGVVSPIGSGRQKYWNALCEGVSGANRITAFDSSDFAVKIAAEVKDIDPAQVFAGPELGKLDRFTQWGIIAADEAMSDAAFDLEKYDLDTFGVIIAAGIGGLITYEEQHLNLMNKGPRRVSPYFIPKMIPDITSGHVSIKYGLKGPNYSVSSACASANHALMLGLRHIQFGDADVMLCGGSEAAVTPMSIAGFTNIKALTRDNDNFETASRPFDATRNGFLLGEGGAVLVLEEYEHARRRGANIYAELAGAGISGDAHHITAPIETGAGAVKSMRDALRTAGMNPEDVTYVNAHGTSTPLNDKVETAAIRQVFGSHADGLTISSTKSMTGHLLGAAGAVEAVASVMAIRHGVVPPTINYRHPDPDCDLDYTPNTAREMTVDSALSNTFGFGGHNATLLFRKI